MTTMTHRDGVTLLNDLMGWLDSASTGPEIRVEECDEGDRHVIRADLPGADPVKDIEVTLEDGMLRLRGRRPADGETRHPSFERFVSCPPGTKADEVIAEYVDGVLTVSVPTTEPVAPQAIPVTYGEPPVD